MMVMVVRGEVMTIVMVTFEMVILVVMVLEHHRRCFALLHALLDGRWGVVKEEYFTKMLQDRWIPMMLGMLSPVLVLVFGELSKPLSCN